MQEQNFNMEEFFHQRMEEEWQNKRMRQRSLNPLAKKGQILFTGSSLMEHFPVEELRMSMDVGPIIYNRGIGGFTTDEFLDNIGPMLLDLEPSKVFINIGTNDISDRFGADGGWLVRLIENYDKILARLKEALPECRVYVMAYYPVNEAKIAESPWGRDAFGTRTNANVKRANAEVEKLAVKFGCRYIDVNEGLTDADGNQKEEYTVDGVHMKPAAYAVILKNMLPYINE